MYFWCLLTNLYVFTVYLFIYKRLFFLCLFLKQIRKKFTVSIIYFSQNILKMQKLSCFTDQMVNWCPISRASINPQLFYIKIFPFLFKVSLAKLCVCVYVYFYSLLKYGLAYCHIKKKITGYKTLYSSQNLLKNAPTPTVLPLRTYNKMLTVVISWRGSSRE